MSVGAAHEENWSNPCQAAYKGREWKNTEDALILVGHGSTENPDSSAPTFEHADAIRGRGIFGEVACAFWKEEPSLREVYRMLDSREIYVVPNFISEGYFTREVIPRELRLSGGEVSEVDGKRVYYCDPVGIHTSMTRLILHRAGEVAPGVAPEDTSLIIVGHGTKLNAKSTEAIKAQVALIEEGGFGFAEVLDAYMEEAPFIAKWDELAASPNVVVVPFFIADGLHSYQDIPVMLGIETGDHRRRERARGLPGESLPFAWADIVLQQRCRDGLADARGDPRPGEGLRYCPPERSRKQLVNV